ncbi:MAG: aminotransferase class IV [Patescibacteria group bacterium]
MSILAHNEDEARLASARPDKGKEALDNRHEEIRADLGSEFVTFDPDLAEGTVHTPEAANPANNPVSRLRKMFHDGICDLLEGRKIQASFPVTVVSYGTITKEEIALLETEGIVLSGVNNEHPHGGISVKDLARSTFHETYPDGQSLQNLTHISATSVLRGVTGLVTRPPIQALPDPLPEGLPRMSMNCLTAAVYQNGKWSQTHMLPDGRWIVEGFDSGVIQYGDGAFEGMVASDKEEEISVDVQNGEVCMFRLVESAKRFIKSCKSIEAPPISVSQFVQAVVEAVKNNKKFIPENGKLYCRAFLAGLQGATGVKPAEKYLFAVEVSPYGDYMKEKAGQEAQAPRGIKVKGVEYKRSEMGTNKVATNYSPIFGLKDKAKKDGYRDVVLLTEDGYIQENSSSNFFAVRNLGKGKFVVATPSLSTNCLPGITRDSLLQLLRDPEIQKRLGREIMVVDSEDQIHEDDILNYADGAWTTGTAAGITNISEFKVSHCDESTKDGLKVFEDEETQRLIQDLQALLKDARCGKVPGYEHWVMKV